MSDLDVSNDNSNEIVDKYRSQMGALDNVLDMMFNPNLKKEVGFVLLVFPFGEVEGNCNYISNAETKSGIANMLKEMAARLEGRVTESGTA